MEINSQCLYKALAPGSKPRYETIVKVMHGLGVELLAKPMPLAAEVKVHP